MILGFKEVFPWGGETKFWQKIIAGVKSADNPTSKPGNLFQIQPKLHTIREGSDRWKPGMTIHMATGVRSKNYWQFNRDIPELGKVVSTQRIDILHRGPDCVIIFIDRKLFYSKYFCNYCPTRHAAEFNVFGFDEFIRNDGFDNREQFWKWFDKPLRNGTLIHWTDLKY